MAENFLRVSERQPKRDSSPAPAQTREGYDDPVMSMFNDYTPLKENIDLYRVLRESIPFIDSAILIRKLLLGKFQIETYGNQSLKDLIEAFIKDVKVNHFQQSLWAFKDELHDATDEVGFAVGELIPFKDGRGIHRLKTCRSSDFVFVKRDEGLTLASYRKDTLQPVPLENMDYIYYLAYDTRQGHPQGKSLLYSLVNHGQVYLRWLKSWENFVIRFGDPSIAVSIEPPENASVKDVNTVRDSIFAQLANVWQKRRKGQTSDLGGGIPGGKVSFSTLGADAVLADHQFSLRTILENIVAKTGLPPYMLGISWASTERMSQMQADKIVSNINSQRLSMEPILRRIIDTFLVMEGKAGQKWNIIWDDVLLLDETEVARAFLFDQQAKQIMLNNLALQIEMGFTTEEEASELIRQYKLVKGVLPKGWFHEAKGRIFVKEMAKNLLN